MAFQKKEDDSAYRQFRRELETGNIGNLYIFYGEETYLRDYYLGELKKVLLTGGLDDFNYHILQGKDMTLQRLREMVDAMPMMSERTFVVVVDYDMNGGKEPLLEIISDLPDYVCLVFVYDVLEYKPDNRSKLSKLLKEKGLAVNFLRQDQKDLTGWIARRFRALGHEIGTEDASYLIFLCGDLMTNLVTEIEKVGAYAKEKRVTRRDIDSVATPQLDAVIFWLTDAVAERNFDKAFSVLGDLLHVQEAPIKILSVLGKQLRQLYAACLAREAGKGSQWVADLWGMRSAYPAEKLMRSARSFSKEWCRRTLLLCEKTDFALKSSGLDGKEALTNLLLDMAASSAA